MDWENYLIKHLQWSDTIINREAKEHVAREIAAIAKDGETVGAGSGSTVYLTLFQLARRIREEHLHIEVIPASKEISMTCIQLGIPQTTLWNKRPDWTFDGTDEVDPQQNLIKGRGGSSGAAARHSSSSTPANGSTGWEANSPFPWKSFPIHWLMQKANCNAWAHRKSFSAPPTEKTGQSLQKTETSSSTPASAPLTIPSKND